MLDLARLPDGEAGPLRRAVKHGQEATATTDPLTVTGAGNLVRFGEWLASQVLAIRSPVWRTTLATATGQAMNEDIWLAPQVALSGPRMTDGD